MKLFHQLNSFRSFNLKKKFTCEETKTIESIGTNSNAIDKTNNFDLTDFKMHKKFMCEYHLKRANENIMDITNKRSKSPETLRLVGKQQEITSHVNFRFKSDSILNRKLWVLRGPDKTRRDKVGSIELEVLFRNNKKSRQGGGYSELSIPRSSTSTGTIE